ncbi:uncharacterized protein BP01DRAFT_353062 [Aspergillus saccharolyticus JOP 1030-1]|uniref:Uncharacterized protein n=1 Tax=Aspergillus saccharolyticus JOP 1030-1 TaxID=1450539 RepID=A0A318ZQ57_9EURO|nr:hypothetical protein BP01DRAFT_353062 [Aspergillus saccharolyticus JOP 1030-1]PYH48755.1 hypothetical protein BP01DRAFT_353062 [Aspergillus saccharolyticus JOP 1030-1]
MSEARLARCCCFSILFASLCWLYVAYQGFDPDVKFILWTFVGPAFYATFGWRWDTVG